MTEITNHERQGVIPQALATTGPCVNSCAIRRFVAARMSSVMSAIPTRGHRR